MSKRVNVIITVIYGLVALALASTLHGLAGLEGLASLLIGAVLFLVFVQFHMYVVHEMESEAVAGELTDLRSANLELKDELDVAREEMQEIARSYEEKSRTRTAEIKSEMRVLESLIQELADGIAEKAMSSGGADAVEPEETEGEAAEGPYLAEGGSGELLDLIQSSLEENRVDLYLQPIVALPQRRILFYEGYTRLRTPSGDLITPRQYLPVAEDAGLMSVIDNLLLFRCVQVVRKLTERHRDTAIFCNISSHSLADQAFFPQFLEFLRHNRDLSLSLIFEFGQDTIEEASKPALDNLAVLAGLGFHFSMDKVHKLDIDPRSLRDRSFRYLKVSAEMLLTGMTTARARFTAEDLKTLLARYGIELIAEKIETERTVIDIIDHEIAYGQGFLFGRPRPIRDAAIGPTVSPEEPLRRAG